MSIQISDTIHFDLPKEKVFEGLTDLNAAKNWMKGFVGIEMIKGAKIETGAVFRETRKMYGKKATEEFEVVSAEPFNEIKLRVDGTKGTMGKGEFLFHYQLEEKNRGTDVTFNGKINGLKGFAALFGKLLAGSFKKACIKDMQSLKNYLEAQK